MIPRVAAVPFYAACFTEHHCIKEIFSISRRVTEIYFISHTEMPSNYKVLSAAYGKLSI